MKGVVFTQFIEMVEDKFGFDTCDEVLESAGVDGIYTQAGNYPASEMFDMIESLSLLTNISIDELLYKYGEYLFTTLIKIYPQSIEKYNNSFSFISNVENVIHPEVKKLYPDSELPSFELLTKNDKEMKIVYRSSKPLMDLAKGLMVGCAKHYSENIEIYYENSKQTKDVYEALFVLIKKD